MQQHFSEKLSPELELNTAGLTSLHTHSTFCDGKDDIETVCHTAYERNLSAVGFSSHVPIEKQVNMKCDWTLKEENVDEYVKHVLAAKQRWQGKLTVYLGYEADYIKGRRSPLDSDITALKLDYIIGSVHFLEPENGTQLFTVDGSANEFQKGLMTGFNCDAQKMMNKYYDAVLEMISQGGFDILGHVDIIKKNTQDKNLWPQEIEMIRQKEVAVAAAKTGIAVEVNTGGINRKKIRDVYPSLSFLKIIRDYDIPVIITSDAHCAGDINGNYDTALITLALAGYDEHVFFNGKNNLNNIWKKVKIYKN